MSDSVVPCTSLVIFEHIFTWILSAVCFEDTPSNEKKKKKKKHRPQAFKTLATAKIHQ